MLLAVRAMRQRKKLRMVSKVQENRILPGMLPGIHRNAGQKAYRTG